MPSPYLLTYQDAVDAAVDFRGSTNDERNQRRIRAAIQSAYRQLAQVRNWRFFYSLARINLNAAQSSSTITYDHTGGVAERLVTIAAGSWPSWAAYGTLRIAGVNYKVATKESSTTLTLAADSCPTADIAAGTSYVLYQAEYALPPDFRALMAPSGENNYWRLQYVAPDEWQYLDRHVSQSSAPQKYTITGSADLYANKFIRVWPYPSTAETLDFFYQRYARPIYYSGYETNSKVGTVSGSAASQSITGSGTAFASRMIGSIIRFSSSTTDLPDGEGGLNPYAEQKVITAVASATALTIDSVLDTAKSGVKYTISDPLDLHPTMIDALRWAVLAELDSLNRGKEYAMSSERARFMLIKACEADADLIVDRVANRMGGADYDPYSVDTALPQAGG